MNALTLPKSILDNDLYKISMQQAVLQHFPSAQVSYKFTNRNPDTLFSRKTFHTLQSAINEFGSLSLTHQERAFLEEYCPYLKKTYLDYLQDYRFDLAEVKLTFLPDSQDDPASFGKIEMAVTGPWHSAILWEVPLMATLSESYFTCQDTDWTMDGQDAKAFDKGKILLENGCAFSEFGTRRRRSFATQDVVVGNLARARDELIGTQDVGALTGTSNVHLAMKHALKPIGTIAHEWFMGIAAINGYENANSLSLKLWEQVYPEPGVLRAALTDTFSSEAFFKDMSRHPELLKSFTSLRQDSGDPFDFAPRAAKLYRDLGLISHDKTVVYSDSLSVEKALNLQRHTHNFGLKASFGIGTNFTNDFTKKSSPGMQSKALNIVIKISTIEGKGCVKISDDLTKNTGRPEEVKRAKEAFGLPIH